MTQTEVNKPLEELTEDELIDLIIILGSFANLCYIKAKNVLPYDKVLLYCLKWHDMNFLKITTKKNGEYVVKNTEIPVDIIQHLVKQEKTFLPKNVMILVNKFVNLAEKEDLFKRKENKKK